MLTGPISEAEYLQCKAYDNGRSKYDTISVSRSALESARTQVHYLANQVVLDRTPLKICTIGWQGMKANHTKLVEEAVNKAKEAAKTAKAEIDIQRKKRRQLEEKLHDTEEEKNRMEKIARSKLRTEKETQQFVEDVSKFLGARAQGNVVKFQAICRSFLVRVRLRRERSVFWRLLARA